MHGDMIFFCMVLRNRRNCDSHLIFDGVIGVLPGEGEALAQFDSIFLTQFHWEQLSAVEATSAGHSLTRGKRGQICPIR